MRTRTFQPSLNDIPEDDYTYYTQSRPQSRSTATLGRRSRVSFKLGVSSQEEVEDLTNRQRIEYENMVSSDPQEGINHEDSFAVDSLDGASDAGSRASTLRRIAKRVNERGTSFVSEIIRTLDKKNRGTLSADSLNARFHNNKNLPTKSPHIVNVNLQKSNIDKYSNESNIVLRDNNNSNGNNVDDRHPELIKPSVLRSLLKDRKQKPDDSSNTFENFCQEMIATFNRMKNYSESKTPASTLGRKIRKQPQEKSVINNVENGEGKVRQWLEGLDKEGLYAYQEEEMKSGSKISDQQVMTESVIISPSIITNMKVNDIKDTQNVVGRCQDANECIDKEIMDTTLLQQELNKLDGIKRNLSENTYEEIKLPKNKLNEGDVNSEGEDESSSSCSDSDSLDSQIIKPFNTAISQENKKITSTQMSVGPNYIDTDDLNTSFDPDTFEKPQKRRNARSRSVLKERFSDYCTTDSDEIYDTSVFSIQSIRPSSSVNNLGESASKGICDKIVQPNDIYDTNLVLINSDIKPPLPPKQSNSPVRISKSPPARPPKSISLTPTLPVSPPPLPLKISKSNSLNENLENPPNLPNKTKHVGNEIPSSRDNPIPELSDEAAASILLGLQARTSPLTTFSPEIKPFERTFSLSEKSNCSSTEIGSHRKDWVNRSARCSFSRKKVAIVPNKLEVNTPISCGEERVRGQFILAPEGKSPSSRRSSLSRSGHGSTSRSSSSDTDVSNKNVKLCQCAKTELEKHFVEKGKPNADSIKQTWRKVMKKTDNGSSRIAKESKFSVIDEEQETQDRCKKCTKQKQEDSGYQSSDSCPSEKSRSSSYDESSCSIDLECENEKLPEMLTRSTKRSSFGPQIFPKSLSLQHLQDVPIHDVYQSFEGSQCSSLSSHSSCSVVSVYAKDDQNFAV